MVAEGQHYFGDITICSRTSWEPGRISHLFGALVTLQALLDGLFTTTTGR